MSCLGQNDSEQVSITVPELRSCWFHYPEAINLITALQSLDYFGLYSRLNKSFFRHSTFSKLFLRMTKSNEVIRVGGIGQLDLSNFWELCRALRITCPIWLVVYGLLPCLDDPGHQVFRLLFTHGSKNFTWSIQFYRVLLWHGIFAWDTYDPIKVLLRRNNSED